MSSFHKDDDDDGDEEFSDEEEEIDLEMIKAKFSSLSSALQETNQNLVTIEMLQDHYRCTLKKHILSMVNQLMKSTQECLQSFSNSQHDIAVIRRRDRPGHC